MVVMRSLGWQGLGQRMWFVETGVLLLHQRFQLSMRPGECMLMSLMYAECGEITEPAAFSGSFSTVCVCVSRASSLKRRCAKVPQPHPLWGCGDSPKVPTVPPPVSRVFLACVPTSGGGHQTKCTEDFPRQHVSAPPRGREQVRHVQEWLHNRDRGPARKG
jgi:hypothetical protein